MNLKEIVFWAIKLGSLVYLLSLVLIFFFQKKIIFPIDGSSWKDCSQVSSGWAPYSYEYNGKTLNGWIKRDSEAKFITIVFHGNGGKACNRTYWEGLLGAGPTEVVLIEYPGYDGTPLTYSKFLENSLDSYDYFSLISKKKVLLVGESLGTSPATYVASKRKPAAMILQSMFPSITELAKYKLPFLPVEIILNYPFPANKWAKEVKAPVLAIHGEKDYVIPYKFGKKQAENFAKCELLKVSNAGHNNWPLYLEDSQRKKIAEFLSLNLDL